MEGLGRALRTHMETARPPKTRKGSLVLDSKVRILVYKEMVERPGSTVPEIARALDKGETTVRWHLRKMEKAGLVQTETVGGRPLLIPGKVYPKEILETMFLLRGASGRLLERIEKEPGLTQGEITQKSGIGRKKVGRLLFELERKGFIRIVRDGPSLRHFPGEGLERARKDAAAWSRGARDRLAQVLHSEVPDIYSISTRGDRLVLEGPFGTITFNTAFH